MHDEKTEQLMELLTRIRAELDKARADDTLSAYRALGSIRALVNRGLGLSPEDGLETL
jgi:hypothetical protein